MFARRRRRGLSYLPPEPTRTPILLYLVLAALFFGGIFYFKSNLLHPVKGLVLDAYTSKPVVNATVTLENDERLARTASLSRVFTTTTTLDGSFTFDKATDNIKLIVEANTYLPNQVQPDKATGIEVRLRPRNLRGIVRDQQGKVVARANVTLNDKNVLTDNDGVFIMEDAPEQGQIFIKAAGYKSSTLNFSKTASLDVNLQPQINKGIYLRAANVADPATLPDLIATMTNNSLNTAVIDLKDSNGLTFYDSKNPLARHAADNKGKIKDPAAVIKAFKERGIYTVARINVFQDASLTDVKPEYALKSRTTGRLWADSARFNWANPYLKPVWDYNIDLAREAAGFGFDEIQFAFVHFPQVGTLSDIEYGRVSDADTRVQAVTGFLKEANTQLSKLGAFISVEVLGQSVLETGDLGIGQDIIQMADFVDYVSPVLFPSYFGQGSFGFDKPATQPFVVINKSLTFARSKLDGKRAQLRPWLQDFSAEGVTYGVAEVKAEIQALDEATKSASRPTGWLLWNGQGRYTTGALKP